MGQIITNSKSIIDFLLSAHFISPVLGVLLGALITYKTILARERILAANDTYQTVFVPLFIKLSTVKINLEMKKKEIGRRSFKRLNKQSKKTKCITILAQQMVDVSDDLHKMVKSQDPAKLSILVALRFTVIDQIKEQIKIAEISSLGLGEDHKMRERRIARLHDELVFAKIEFVEEILQDMKKVSTTARMKDKDIKAAMKFLLKTCRSVKKNGISKTYGMQMSQSMKIFDIKNKPAS